MTDPIPNTTALLDQCGERALEDYKRVSAFIRARAPQDPDVQAAAVAALKYMRLVAAKLAYLAVRMEGDDQP